MIASAEYLKPNHNDRSGSAASGSCDTYSDEKVVKEAGAIIGALSDLSYAVDTLDEAFGELVDKLHPVLHEPYPQVIEESKEEDGGSSVLYMDITASAYQLYRIRDFINEIKVRVQL